MNHSFYVCIVNSLVLLTTREPTHNFKCAQLHSTEALSFFNFIYIELCQHIDVLLNIQDATKKFISKNLFCALQLTV